MLQQTPLTHESFWGFVRSHEFALIHFWATWNGYDAQMRKLLDEQVPNDPEPRVAVGTLDTGPQEHWEICRQHKVHVPFLALYRDGSLIRTSTGLAAGEPLIQDLLHLLADSA